MAKRSHAKGSPQGVGAIFITSAGHVLGGISYFMGLFGYMAVVTVIAAAVMNLMSQLTALLTESQAPVEVIGEGSVGASATIFELALVWIIGSLAVVASLAAIVYIIFKTVQLCSRFVHFLVSKLSQGPTFLAIITVKAGLYFIPVIVSIGMYIAQPSQLMLAVLWWSVLLASVATIVAAAQTLLWCIAHKNVKNIL